MKSAATVSDLEYETKGFDVDSFPRLRTIKYGGNKLRLLPAIVWIVRQVVKSAGTILDLMAGTHCVGYALKQQYRICANDIQEYSFVIGKAFIENGGYVINRNLAEKELLKNIQKNKRNAEFNLFQKAYANTYFTTSQCREIDNIRAAIEAVPTPRRELYLTMLMSTMCYASNTTGHFAEYLNKPASSPKSVQELFFEKCENLSVVSNSYVNRVFNLDYKEFLSETEQELVEIVEGSDLIYIDPPYSSAQYSRFYHILETLVKYDYPTVEFKGRYRRDRHFSGFCRKSMAQSELDNALRKCSEINKGFILLSYVDSSSSLIPKEKFEEIVHNHFSHATKALTCQISHSKLGNGASKKVTEYLILATNSKQGKIVVDRINNHHSVRT
jgi:adenine-specific DNA-methyltransferase